MENEKIDYRDELIKVKAMTIIPYKDSEGYSNEHVHVSAIELNQREPCNICGKSANHLITLRMYGEDQSKCLTHYLRSCKEHLQDMRKMIEGWYNDMRDNHVLLFKTLMDEIKCSNLPKDFKATMTALADMYVTILSGGLD